MVIRKVSIGADYKSSSMHYIVGQDVLGATHKITHIRKNDVDESIVIWIEKNNKVYKWKEFNKNMPISIEYNINFK